MRRVLTFAIPVLVMAAGCQTASPTRYIQKQTDGGIIALSQDTPSERDKAFALISRHVGPNFVVEKEEEIKIAGAEKKSPSEDAYGQMFSLFPKPSREYRIYYQRSGGSTAKANPDRAASHVIPASASLPIPTPQNGVVTAVATSVTTSVTTEPTPVGKKFLPLTWEGCQSR